MLTLGQQDLGKSWKKSMGKKLNIWMRKRMINPILREVSTFNPNPISAPFCDSVSVEHVTVSLYKMFVYFRAKQQPNLQAPEELLSSGWATWFGSCYSVVDDCYLFQTSCSVIFNCWDFIDLIVLQVDRSWDKWNRKWNFFPWAWKRFQTCFSFLSKYWTSVVVSIWSSKNKSEWIILSTKWKKVCQIL